MRACLIHRYFWPDTPPYASILRSIAGRLAADGHEVTVFSTQPSYNASEELPRQPRREMLDGFRVVRCRLPGEARRSTISRLLDMLLFSARVFWHVLRGRYDVVMAGSIPPVATATAARLAAGLTRTKFVYHDMDIYPEAALISGLMREGIAYRTLRRIDTGNCRRAEVVVVLSEDMADTIADRSIPRDHIRVLNNFELDDFAGESPDLPEDLRRPDDALRIAFAGNVGRFQGLETVIDAARQLPSDVHARIEILGDGRARPALEQRAGELLGNRVRFHGHRSYPVSKAFVASADLALITLRPGIHRVAFPSKTMTYLSCGTPVIVIADTHSELAGMVDEEKVGFVVAPGDDPALARVIADVATDIRQLAPMRRHADELFRARFDRARVLEKWSQLHKELEKSHGGLRQRQHLERS